MTREILFKAKRKNWRDLPKEEWWVEGNFITNEREEGTAYIGYIFDVHNGVIEDFDIVEVAPETLCQYTGLTDKNGKGIWENDIVVCKKYIGGNFIDYCTECGFVEMKHSAFGLHRREPDAYYRPFKDWLEDYEYEVIGNIYDGDVSELLGGAE